MPRAIPEFKRRFLEIYRDGDNEKMLEYLQNNPDDFKLLCIHPIKEFADVIRNISSLQIGSQIIPLVFEHNPFSIITIFGGREVSYEVQTMILASSRPYFIRSIANQNEELMCVFVSQYHKAFLSVNNMTQKIFNSFVESFPNYGKQIVNMLKHHKRPTLFFDRRGFNRMWRAHLKSQEVVV